MSYLFNVSSSSLFHRQLALEDREFDSASLCPFFTSDGHVAWLMLLSDEPDVRFFRPQETAVKVPFWGPIRIGCVWSRLQDLKPEDLSRLWHFDPKMLLKQPHLAFHPLAKTILATNCFNRFAWKTKSLWFKRNLQTVDWVCKEEDSFTRFKPAMLPSPPTFELETRDQRLPQFRSSWKLAPFWETTGN